MSESIPSTLNFSVILDKKTGELTLSEGSLLTLKIPKHWQKTDTDTKNPALWVCHLPENSWGITMFSFFATELEIKKKNPTKTWGGSNNLLTYRGSLEITSENENQIFYRCHLKLVEEKKSGQGLAVFLGIILLIIALIAIMIKLSD